jgi:hypothetical protein
MKVRYPGPAVSGPALTQDQVHMATGVRLVPGVVFDVSPEIRAELGALVEDVVVLPPPAEKPAETEQTTWLSRVGRDARKSAERRARERAGQDSPEAPAESDGAEDQEPKEGDRP